MKLISFPVAETVPTPPVKLNPAGAWIMYVCTDGSVLKSPLEVSDTVMSGIIWAGWSMHRSTSPAGGVTTT